MDTKNTNTNQPLFQFTSFRRGNTQLYSAERISSVIDNDESLMWDRSLEYCETVETFELPATFGLGGAL